MDFNYTTMQLVVLACIAILALSLWILWHCLCSPPQHQHHPFATRKFNNKILLIGGAGSGKTLLFSKLSDINYLEFPEYQLNEKYSIVDTPSIEFDDNIDHRETVIEQYQNFFREIQKRVSLFIILVKFERTDIMKQNIMKVFKYFQKYKNIIRILVTQFQLSETPVNDQKELKNKFKLFVNSEDNIDFIRNDTSKENLLSEYFQNLTRNLGENCEQIDLQDTIFEEITQEQQKQALGSLYKKLPQGENC